MTAWSEIATAAPELADAVRERFEATGLGLLGTLRAKFTAGAGEPPPPGPMHLFRADVSEISILRPAGDHLDIRWWTESGGEHQLDRY